MIKRSEKGCIRAWDWQYTQCENLSMHSDPIIVHLILTIPASIWNLFFTSFLSYSWVSDQKYELVFINIWLVIKKNIFVNTRHSKSYCSHKIYYICSVHILIIYFLLYLLLHWTIHWRNRNIQIQWEGKSQSKCSLSTHLKSPTIFNIFEHLNMLDRVQGSSGLCILKEYHTHPQIHKKQLIVIHRDDWNFKRLNWNTS